MKLLFLEGEKGIGKSTMILESAKPMQQQGSGLFTQRLTDKQGETKAFALRPYRAVEQSIIPYADMYEKDIFIKCGCGIKGVNLKIFQQAEKLIENRQEAKFIVLDEIGGVELACDSFWILLHKILVSGIPCIGVVKSKNNWTHLKRKVSNLEESSARYEQLRTDIQNLGGEIITLDKNNHEEIKKRVAYFFEEIKGGKK